MNAKPSPVNPLLEGPNQRRYEFRLDNTAFGSSAEGVIYRERAAGDANILVLTLTNSSEKTFTLTGGTMPASNNSVPPTPTTVFLTFGNKELTESLSLDSLAVEFSTDGSAWTAVSQPESGWCFARFNANRPTSPPYVGLCPLKDFNLDSNASVRFRFTKLRCTYTGTSSQQLQIGCYNLAGGSRDSSLQLHVIDPPTYLSAFSDVFTPSITSRTVPHEWTSGNAEVLVTPDAVLEAAGDRLVNELKLTFSCTGTGAAGIELAQSSFMLTFVAGTKYDNGALTTASDISNITYQMPDGWKVEKQDGTDNTPTSWLIQPPDNMKLTKLRPVEIIFTNIKIGQGFPAGLTYVSLTNRNVKGYRDGHYALPVSRAAAKPSITDFRLSTNDPSLAAAVSYLRGAEELIDFNGTVYLSWKAFAVPYLQIEYQTLDDHANLMARYVEYVTLDRNRTLSCDSFRISNIKADTGFILRGYNTPPGNTRIPDHTDEDPAKRKPLVQATSMTSIRVKHSNPVIKLFWVTCSPKEALLKWSVTFGELESWLSVEILDQNGPVYRPQPAEKVAGKHLLTPPNNGVFDEKTTFRLQAWSSQLQTEKPTSECRLGSGLDLIKYFTGKPRSPQVLGPATVDFDLEVQFSQLTECSVVQDPPSNAAIFVAPEDKQRPNRRVSGKYPTFSAHNISKGRGFHVRASGAEAQELIEYHTTINELSVRDFVFKRTTKEYVRRFHPEGYEKQFKYSHDVGQNITIRDDHRADYYVNMGAEFPGGSGKRTIVAVRYLSIGPCYLDDTDGHYYFDFDGKNQQAVPPTGDMRGDLYQYGLGWYKVVAVKPFRYRITSEGLQGGPNWYEGGIEVGFPNTAGWWKSRPDNGDTGNTFTWA
jgi:hypothetical protein